MNESNRRAVAEMRGPRQGLSQREVYAAPTLRSAHRKDVGPAWRLARDSNVLEENSEYAYHMFFHYFQDTCAVAEVRNTVVGFVAGFRPFVRPGTLFVWQVAVEPDFRGRGVAGAMLELLVQISSPRIRYLEATVTPDNLPSRRAFHRFAQCHGLEPREILLFPGHLFVGGSHDDEILVRIGPLGRVRKTNPLEHQVRTVA